MQRRHRARRHDDIERHERIAATATLDPMQRRVVDLQRGAGNRAVSSLLRGPATVQRYAMIGPAATTDYTPAAGTEFSSQDREVDRTNLTAGYSRTKVTAGPAGFTKSKEKKGNTGWAITDNNTPATKPQLKFSHQGTSAMAIQSGVEAKNFFATDDVKAASNQALDGKMADIRVEESGGSLTVTPGGGGGGAPLTLKSLKAATTAQTAGKFTIKDVIYQAHECNSFVKGVIGDIDARAAVFEGGHEARVSPEHEPTKEIASFAETGGGGGQQLAAHLKTTTSGAHGSRLPGYMGMPNKRARGQALGINEAALPEAGEGYVIMSNTPMPGSVPLDRYAKDIAKKEQGTLSPAKAEKYADVWSYHYAGVVAKLGGDTVTYENYNRGTVENWTVNTLYDRVFTQSAEFRNRVKTILGDAGQVPLIPKERTAFWKRLRAELAKEVAAGNALSVQLAADLDKIDKAEKGLQVNLSALGHFKMYGSGAGQSFHEEWGGGHVDPVTLRIRESVVVARQNFTDKVADLVAKFKATGVAPPHPAQADAVANALVVPLATANTPRAVFDVGTDYVKRVKDLAPPAIGATWNRAAIIAGKNPVKAQQGLTDAQLGGVVETWSPKGVAILPKARKTKKADKDELATLADRLKKLAAFKAIL